MARGAIRISAGLGTALALAALALLAGDVADQGSTLARMLPAAEVARLDALRGSFPGPEETTLVVLDGADGAWAPARIEALAGRLDGLAFVRAARVVPLPADGPAGPRLLHVDLAPGTDTLPEARARTAALDEVLAAAAGPGERAFALGWPRLRAESWALARADLRRALVPLAVLALGVPWLFLGSAGAGLLALALAAGTAALTLWGQRIVGGPLSPLTLLALPLLWAVATTDALHLAARARELAARGLAPREAAARARRELAAPCAWTSLTTAVGLALLAALGHAPLLEALGLTCALGTLLAWALAFGPCAPWLVLVTGGRAPRWPRAAALAVIRGSRRHARAVVASWALALVLAGLGATRLEVASTFPRLFAPDVPLERDLAHLARATGTDLVPLELVVEATDADGRRASALLAAAVALGHELHALPGARTVLPLDLLAGLGPDASELPSQPDAREALLASWLARPELVDWVDPATGRARLQLLLAPRTWSERAALLARLAHFDDTMLSHHVVHAVGTAALLQRAEAIGLADLARGAPATLLVLAALLALALRRARAAAVALLASALPLVLVAGLMGALAIPWSLTLLPLPIVLLGLAVDDSLHLLWRAHGTVRHASLTAILATTALVAGSVATLAASSFTAGRVFGPLLALGLVLALALDLSLLPALVRGSRRRAPRSAR